MTVALVTGGNRGIGLELCRQLRERGDTVFAACRKASSALQQLDVTVLEGVDVTDSASIGRVADVLWERDVRLDLLINNAGILRRESLDEMDYVNVVEQFEVNALGPLKVVVGLLDVLADGAKVGLVTSRMGSLADNTSGGSYGYRMSKAALNMAGVSLAKDLKERGIAVALLHPGFVRTEMTGGQGFIDADEAARGLVERMNGLNLENSGTFWHQNGEVLPW
jgi:NAD(P)-dependent dehydrogenase (short-subunit alcohol dehydrogenase family)